MRFCPVFGSWDCAFIVIGDGQILLLLQESSLRAETPDRT